MARLVKVMRSMLIFRAVAASHVTTNQADAQVHPSVAHFEALLATFRRSRLYVMNVIEMGTRFHLSILQLSIESNPLEN